MVGFIKTIFSGLLGLLVAILKLPITLITLPLKLLSGDKNKTSEGNPAAKKKKSGGAFYLEADDAKGFTEAAPKADPVKADVTKTAAPTAPSVTKAASAPATTASALNLPQPKVTQSAPEIAYSQFGPRRAPGANMKSFLDMAKTVRKA